MIRSVTTLLTLLACSSLVAAERKLEINDGDCVLLIGDAFIERENNYGYLESRMRQEAVSPKGARGVMQLMPATAADLRVNPDDM